MANEKYDVVIVGGSFAGLAAGKEAAERGLKTLIVERGREPGDKILSGTAIPPWIFLEMPWLEQAPMERWVNAICNHIIEDGSVSSSVQANTPFEIPLIYCKTFLKWLAEKAESAGAELRTSTVSSSVIKEKDHVRGIITEDGKEVRSDIVIAADGIWSMTATKAGLRRKLQPDNMLHLVAYDMVMPSKEALDEALGSDGKVMHTFWNPTCDVLPKHFCYAGIFPNKSSFHLEGGTALTYLGREGRDYDKLYKRFCEMPWYRERFGEAKLRSRMWRPYATFEGLQYIWRGHDKTYGNGIMIIGDAGGLMCTASGAGISAALLSGRMAAEVAAEAVSKGDASKKVLQQFEEKWKNSIIHEMQSNYGRRDIFRSSDIIDIKRQSVEMLIMPLVLQQPL